MISNSFGGFATPQITIFLFFFFAFIANYSPSNSTISHPRRINKAMI